LKELAILEVWIFVLGMFIGGLARGLQLNQPFIFADANAWIFLLYIIPVLDVAHRFGPQLKKYVTGSALASLIWLPIKILAVFYVFTHGLGILDWLYVWIRNTRVGEITDLKNGFYRIFFQSAVYSALALPFVTAWWIEKKDLSRKGEILTIALGGLCGAALLLSLSRSFWLGAVVSIILILAFGIHRALKYGGFKNFSLALAKGFLAAAVSFFIILVAWRLPIPHAVPGSRFDFFGSRATVSDPASASRWNLLSPMLEKIWQEPVLGSGLGSTVTYKSQDPRILEQSPNGITTTYAFEWGWLGLWIKFGIFGLLVMGWLLISIVWRVWKSNYSWWIRVGVLSGTFGLAVIHFFTPYLDHPLGFAWIIGVEGLLALRREELEPHLQK
jgi:hypothetical protein